MSWHDEWQGLGGRIAGLLEAGEFVIQSLQVNSQDAYGATTRLSKHAKSVVDDLTIFATTFAEVMPRAARLELERFLQQDKPLFQDNLTGFDKMQVFISTLASFRASFEYHLRDVSALAKARTERAFVHLQQTIVTDSGARDRWETAFEKGEMACEHLGAVHLLLHGVWSFKVHGIGARTDLVCGEPLETAEIVERTAEALVLTEWKRVTDPSARNRVADAGRNQAHMYAGGVLSAIELRDQRYVVLVSRDRLPPIPDADVDGVRYRHINVAVAPSVPSRAAG